MLEQDLDATSLRFWRFILLPWSERVCTLTLLGVHACKVESSWCVGCENLHLPPTAQYKHSITACVCIACMAYGDATQLSLVVALFYREWFLHVFAFLP